MAQKKARKKAGKSRAGGSRAGKTQRPNDPLESIRREGEKGFSPLKRGGKLGRKVKRGKR